MPVNLKWRLAVVLLGVGLWVHPGEASKIQQFKDDQGTVHINNAREAASDKAEPEGKPGSRRRPKFPAAPPVAPSPPEPVAQTPAAEEAKQGEAAAVVQEEEEAPIAGATTRGGHSEGFGRGRGGRR